MKLTFSRFAIALNTQVALAAAFALPAFASPLTLEGLSIEGVTANGSSVGYYYGENATGAVTNSAGTLDVNLATVSTGSPVANLNSGYSSNLNYSLSTPGSYRFTVSHAPDIGGPGESINIFFDNGGSPKISAWALKNSTSFLAEGAPNTIPFEGFNNPLVAAANSLIYDNGSETVVLTALNFEESSASFTLNVTADAPTQNVPEPATLSLIGAGLIVIGGLHKLRNKR
ncbi:PEP-CTERM sorting domain-containing protein [Telmatospirillum sp.]|uniref:PEP-CTERM sorting domain-containing protein n=1 Tax=Telmatospirillum sp. TaxID=2079197 RepID=UPI00283CFAFB|nr:PEP-CTERM sorting domain-containing protein [Telmatospirillum sp.]MDR3441048.1 PEP-CTERM sorting domain-containing protein [Telmatospirillum sp.]